MKEVLAIDPGLTGAFVYLTDSGEFEFEVMPIIKNDKDKEIDFDEVSKILKHYDGAHVILERAMPMAMGAKHAFNYGRGFAALEIAIKINGSSVTYVEPQKWAKVMHDGISSDLKPKAKSVIAVNRLFKKMVKAIPASKNGKLHEGIVDALLLAGYGLRQI